MRGTRRAVLAVALCCLAIALVGTAGGSSAGVLHHAAGDPVGADPPAGDLVRAGSLAGHQANPTELGDGDPGQTVHSVVVTQEFARLPDRPGHVRVTRRFDLPDNVRSLRTTLPDDATVTGTSGGFSQIEATRWEWSGGSRTPSITHTLPVNETGEVRGPEGADGRYLFADTGEWGLFRRPNTPVDVTYVGDATSAIRFEDRSTVAGPGAAGDWLVYLGDQESVQRRADGQTLRLVVPAAADLVESRSEILDSVSAASTSLRVGQRDDEVLMVAAPTSVDWAVEGLQTGDSDLYVTADERVDEVDNVWLHEYVHTRQDFNLTREVRWAGEATATYYAALLSLEQDRVGFGEFQRFLGTGQSGRYDSVVLTDQDTWVRGANYRKGALVTGELDRRLRVATDSESDFQAVFRALNERRGETDPTAFVSLVQSAGTADVADAAERYTRTTDSPEVWGVAQHGEAFGRLPPRIDVSPPEDTADADYRVDGSYRNRTLGEPPFVLVPGERLSVDVHLSNEGGTAGDYNLTYGLDDGLLEARTGSLDPGESVTETVTVRVDALGSQRVRVGEYTVPITVAEPSTPRVSDLRVNRTAVSPGETVGVTVDLDNSADRPGGRNLTVTRDGTTISTEPLRVDAETSETVERAVTLNETGAHRLTVGNESVTVQVGAGVGSTDAFGPGIGAVGAVIAVLAAAVIAFAVERARRRG